MANQQQSYVYHFKTALGALDKAISSTANISTSGNIATTGTGTITSAGTLVASAAATVGTTLGVTGNFAVNTNKFTVTAASGNTLVAGTFDATGDVAVNTNKFNVTAASGNTTIAGTLGVTGVTTLTGGQAVTSGTTVRQWNHAGEAVLNARGTDTAVTAGTIYYGGWIPEYNMTVTNVNVLNGSVVGTDKLIVGIYSVDGTLLQSSALAGILSTGADVYQQLPLAATQAVVAGTEYLVAVQVEGTTAQLQLAAANFRVGTGRTGSQAGSFGTMATIGTVASTFTADLAPLFFVD